MEDDLRQCLRELVADADALGAAIVPAAMLAAAPSAVAPHPDALPPPVADAVVARPLGMGAVLRVWFAPDDRRARATSGAAVERGVRALRACFRRWEAKAWPAVSALSGPAPAGERVIERIEAFLTALATTHDAAGAVVTLRGRVMARSGPLDPLDEAQIPFLLARVDHEIRRSRGDSSHAEISSDAMYVLSFWYGACLIAFFRGPFALDFFRHRARMVARELSQLLPLLDDPPPGAAQRSPRPD